MAETIETRVSVLEEKQSSDRDYIKRLISHFDSERGLGRERGLRVDSIEKTVEVLDKMIRNGGEGINVRVDRIEQRLDSNKDSMRWFVPTIISLLGLLISILNFFIDI